MNSSYRSLWNDSTGTFVAVPENASSAGKKTSSGVPATGLGARFVLQALAVSVMLAFGTNALAQPTGGVVASGAATISSGATSTTITQSTQNAVINWQSFNIAAGQSVQFVQPTSSSITLNRVVGADPSSILGSLSANGKVFLINPNGILFGQGASVNVGGLVASTLNMTDADFNAGNYKFSGNGTGSVVNQGNINADGGYVALLGANVSNQGTISAQLGSAVLAAGKVMTMDMAGDGLLNIAVTEGAVNALVDNRGLIRADGGQVLLTTQAAGSLLQNAVNNTGVIQAQTLVTGKTGSIMLMGGMETGTVNVGGTLDASAPKGGNGGFIETSAAHVVLADNKFITTLAPNGKTGMWLLDPVNWQIGNDGTVNGDETPAEVVTSLASTDRTIVATNDITVAEAVTWTTPRTLTLDAGNDVIIKAAMTGTGGNLVINAGNDVNLGGAVELTNGNLTVCCGRDIDVKAAITTTNGSILLSGSGAVTVDAAITATDGNLTICAGVDVSVNQKITVTNGSVTAGENLGLLRGLALSAGNAATGPGAAGGGGSVIFGVIPATVTAAPTNIAYNPVSYSAPLINYVPNIIGTAPIARRMVFPDGADRTFVAGSTVANFTSFKPDINGLVPANITLAGAGSASFADPAVGNDKIVTFSGFTLAGTDAALYALPNTVIALPLANPALANCCGGGAGRTTANINAVVPPVVPPVIDVTPDITTPPVETTDVVGTDLFPDMPYEGPVVNRRTPSPTWAPVVVLADTPAQLQSLTPPAVFVPPVPVELPPVAPKEEVIETTVQPPVYVAPVRPRKQDRN